MPIRAAVTDTLGQAYVCSFGVGVGVGQLYSTVQLSGRSDVVHTVSSMWFGYVRWLVDEQSD